MSNFAAHAVPSQTEFHLGFLARHVNEYIMCFAPIMGVGWGVGVGRGLAAITPSSQELTISSVISTYLQSYPFLLKSYHIHTCTCMPGAIYCSMQLTN